MRPTDATVRSLVAAINGNKRQDFLALLTPDATMSDDGTDRDLHQWIDREIFDVNGRMEVLSESAGGRELIARFRNDTWGEMRTSWRFDIQGDKIQRLETGQA
ncbi:nuclear transport factor 2 family protein [Embleya sp. NBC_00896]|uniref:nuclear transport factor 2 family protein n=1 Tax=Embleya sp. NBC_00896 TaxID=2975961 RepID=UPI002F906DA9|nr:nuclear transport factor 2 family protein [Embleya sp. NBC_00896]